MSDKKPMTVDKVVESLPRNPHRFEVRRALLKFAAKEAEPLMEALEKITYHDCRLDGQETCIKCFSIASEAVKDFRAKYPKEKL